MTGSGSLFGEENRKKAGAPGAGAPAQREPGPLTVSQLAGLIDHALKTTLPQSVRVAGEISHFNDRTHWYFTLKDEEAVVSCVMFARRAREAGFTPQVGQGVLATGRVEHYARQGRTQLYVERLEPIGAGALEAQFRALCDELRRLGWFDEDRKRALPAFPRRIAVITSKTGAALQDVLDTFRRRAPFVDLLVLDALVQGDRAASDIAAALRRLGARRVEPGVDAILITRGGGSMEDLWAFNDRALAEAILQSPIPVVAAIGHETDTTIAELVADVRAATPTQAAVRLSPDRDALIEQIDAASARLRSSLGRFVAHERQRLRAVARLPFFADPASLARERRTRLEQRRRDAEAAIRARLSRSDLRLERLGARLARRRPEAVFAVRRNLLYEMNLRLDAGVRARLRGIDLAQRAERLRRAAQVAMRRAAATLDARERELVATSPTQVLRRGYSVTRREDGRVVRSPTDVRTGDAIETVLIDGRLRSVVAPDGPGPARPARDRTKRPDRSDDQEGSLFDS